MSGPLVGSDEKVRSDKLRYLAPIVAASGDLHNFRAHYKTGGHSMDFA